MAAGLLEARDVAPQVFVTERAGHARELSRALIAQGVRTIVAWGGDGTVNEIGSALAFSDVALAIVPSGSGNGLARELQIPFKPADALRVAVDGAVRVMDAGELDGHLFFNVAGIGLDARVAHRFAASGLVKRGFARYIEITLQELFAYQPDEHTITMDGQSVRERTMLIAIANARQYGNGALIAPDASIDDGRLDVVVIRDRSVFRALTQIPRIFMGQIAKVQGVSIRKSVDVEVTSARPVVYHVDGEPFVGGASIRAAVRPAALRVRVPQP